MSIQVNIYAVNDVHSNFENYGCIASVFKQTDIEKDLVVDSGDFHDYKSVLVSATNALSSIQLQQYTHTACMTIGNNEFFGPEGSLQEMIDSGFPLLSCNLFQEDGSQIPHLKPSMIIERNGVRFLIIGVSPVFHDYIDETGKLHRDGVFMKLMHLSITDPYEPIEKELRTYQGQYDMAVVLSHAGIKWDRKIAEKVNGIDLICGGHSHTIMQEMEMINSTGIIQSGCYGEYYTKIACTFTDTHQLVSMKSELINRPKKADESYMTLLQKETEEAEKKYQETMYTLDHALAYDPFEECEAMNVLCDIMHAHYPSDLALMNHGILSQGISAEVSMMSLLQTSPSPLNPTIVPYTGKQLLEAINSSLDPDFIRQDGMGPGFRGTVLGTLAVSDNVIIHQDPFTVHINGELLNPNKTYSVITDDYLQRGTGYTMLKVDEVDCTFFPEYIRDVLLKYLSEKESFVHSKQKRIL